MTTRTERQKKGTRIVDAAVWSAAPIGEGGMGVVEDLWVNLSKLRDKGFRTDLLRRCMIDGARCDLVRPSRHEMEASCTVVKRGKASHLDVFHDELRLTRAVARAIAASGQDVSELTALPAQPYYYSLVLPDEGRAEVPLIPMRRMASDALDHFFAAARDRGSGSGSLEPVKSALVRCVATLLVFCDAVHAAGIAHVDTKLENMLVRDSVCSPIRPGALPSEFVVIDFGLSRIVVGDRRLRGLRGAGGTPGYFSPTLRHDEESRAAWAAAGCAREYSDLLARPPTPGTVDFHSMGASIAHAMLFDDAAIPSDLRDFAASVVKVLLLGHAESARDKLVRLERLSAAATPFLERARYAARFRQTAAVNEAAAKTKTNTRRRVSRADSTQFTKLAKPTVFINLAKPTKPSATLFTKPAGPTNLTKPTKLTRQQQQQQQPTTQPPPVIFTKPVNLTKLTKLTKQQQQPTAQPPIFTKLITKLTKPADRAAETTFTTPKKKKLFRSKAARDHVERIRRARRA